MPVPTRRERQAQTRRELLSAAERLFCASGFHATTLDAVAEAAGYTKGAVYSNFSSKEDLFFAVYEGRGRARREELHRFFEESSSALDGVRGSFATAGRRAQDGWLAVFFEFWAHVLRNPELRERFAAVHRQMSQPFVDDVERVAAEQGVELPLPAELVATAVLALANGLQLERLTRPEEITADRIEQMLWLLVASMQPGAESQGRRNGPTRRGGKGRNR